MAPRFTLFMLLAGILVLTTHIAGLTGGELLYNGIELPDQWPPRIEQLTREPMPVPYLEHRPAVVPINIGRQLFVDDFLVEECSLQRTFHTADFHPINPILTFDKSWEKRGKSPVAYPYSGGAWYDFRDKLFKIWYSGQLDPPGIYGARIHCLAHSKDGVHWKKPVLDIEPGTNIVLRQYHDGGTVWLDENTTDPSQRYKLFSVDVSNGVRLTLFYSADGIHWRDSGASGRQLGDRTTCFYNPFRKVWVVGVRIGGTVGRARAYVEDANPETLVGKLGTATPWCGADKLDPHNPRPEFQHIEPQLYNLDVVAYESLMLGLFAIWQGPGNQKVAKLGIQKRCDLLVGFSRDGFHWHRPDRRRFLAGTDQKGDWNFGNIQSAGGCCLVVGDKLYFYVSGREEDASGWHGRSSTGLAVLRRDGFTSLDASPSGGSVTTRPVTFQGQHLRVNVDCPEGKLLVEVLDEKGNVIPPLTEENCIPVTGNSTNAQVQWNGASDLSAIAGIPVRFRFSLTNGSLYSFWVSADSNGASHGYVSAGGPGFRGVVDLPHFNTSD